MSEDKTYYTATRYGFGTHDKLIVEKLKDKSWPEILREIACQYEAEDKPKPEWEILKGQSDARGVHTWRKIEEAHEHPCPLSACRIYSVRRLSDGEVFTVGEVFLNLIDAAHTIVKFQISEWSNEMKVISDNKVEYAFKIIRKQKEGTVIPVLLTPSQIEKLKTLLK